MNIQEIAKKFKGYAADDQTFTAIVLILVGLAAFGLGRASGEPGQSPIQKEETAVAIERESAPGSADTATSQRQYVASKSGSKYHLPWCSGASRIKEENRVWFDSKEEAEAAGYTPAANCKGI